jgi:hypothetical protein
MNERFIAELEKKKVPYIKVSGTRIERLKQAVDEIDKLLNLAS